MCQQKLFCLANKLIDFHLYPAFSKQEFVLVLLNLSQKILDFAQGFLSIHLACAWEFFHSKKMIRILAGG